MQFFSSLQQKTYVVALTQFLIQVYRNMDILWSQFLWYLKFVISNKLFTTAIYSLKLIVYVIVFTAVSLGTLSPEYLWLVLIELVLNEMRKVSAFSAFHFSFENQSSILRSLSQPVACALNYLIFSSKSDKIILYPSHTFFHTTLKGFQYQQKQLFADVL